MYSRFMNDPLDEEYLLSPGIVGSYADGEIPAEEIEVREAVRRATSSQWFISPLWTGNNGDDQAICHHRSSHYLSHVQ
ncbi:TPA: hypothetical protein MJA80_23215 [Klebsiella pneumoniae]|uniref:Uncharacterized protein n=1 Tax=Klebsiella pneumoniae TaxID=573 RepID=A0A2X3DG20_KLEPN|nr:hypothetical protein D9K64_26740 [Klebsiella pneumoniae]RLO14415.1 hypothetical protein D1220_28150 [Klebsiella pneumoniae]SQC23334.1 Uncharacterised protein [Klebsiella pneumoniae]SQC28634.1 Uncharacterised protein [Klebsiella pneumoniae]SQC88288.1 Uncharacterised protein [Klebsiella pneumoniae]